MTTITKPLEYAKENILGMIRSIEQRYGCTPIRDINTTFNHKFNVQPSRLPANDPKVGYFCWGNGGRHNDSSTLSSAQYVLGTNMAPYSIRPFRAVPLEEDLSVSERANYAMRKVTTIDGVPYCLYYLKKITFSTSTVQLIHTDPVSKATTTYELDYNNLTNPTPPEGDANGVFSDISDNISVILPGTVVLTGAEVYEAISVLDGGESRMAVCSELGFVSASAEQVSAMDAANNPFNYSEAIFAQMVQHYTNIGHPFLSTADVMNKTLQFSVKNIIL